MTDDTALERDVASLLFHSLNVEVSSVHDDLIDNALLDSLKIVELVVQLEGRFALRIPFEVLEIESFRSVASIARLVACLCASTEMANSPAAAASGRAVRMPAAD